MQFPDAVEILEVFGLSPSEEDATMGYRRYVKQSDDGVYEMDFSFSAVSDSFQVVLRVGTREVMKVSSESVRLIEIRRDREAAELRVLFDANETESEAILTFEPRLHCYWWTLRR